MPHRISLSNKDKFANGSIGNISAGKVSGRNIDDPEFTMIVSDGNDQVVEYLESHSCPILCNGRCRYC